MPKHAKRPKAPKPPRGPAGLTPFDVAVALYSTKAALARALGVTRQAVAQWEARGVIEVKYIHKIIGDPALKGKRFSANDLFFGR